MKTTCRRLLAASVLFSAVTLSCTGDETGLAPSCVKSAAEFIPGHF
jgi:hypothetical protein